MFFWIAVAVVLFAAVKRAPKAKKRTPPLLYSRGELKGNLAVFPCGCRFDWAQPEAEPTICEAHRIMIDAMVEA